jgi:hypothetical protein
MAPLFFWWASSRLVCGGLGSVSKLFGLAVRGHAAGFNFVELLHRDPEGLAGPSSRLCVVRRVHRDVWDIVVVVFRKVREVGQSPALSLESGSADCRMIACTKAGARLRSLQLRWRV